jgi:4'-phosphopantetheinyl transferase EntD
MSVPTDVRAQGPLTRLFDEDDRVVVAEMDPRLMAPGTGLFPEEASAIERAVLSRRQQFTAGRCLARQAWQRLGQGPVALINDEQRVPIWPSGIVGTITHTHTWCAAAVARRSLVAGLGADVESATPLDVDLWERICRPEERAFLSASSDDRAGLLAKGLFSIKESIYKALYPSVRLFLDFQGMHVTLVPSAREEGRFGWRATLQVAWGPLERGRSFGPGQLQLDSDLISSAIVL